MRLLLPLTCLVLCSCDSEVAVSPPSSRLDAVSRSDGPDAGARYGASVASCGPAVLVTGAPGVNTVFSNDSGVPLSFSGAGSAVACSTTNVATVAPDAGAIVFNNRPPLTDAGTFNLNEASLAFASNTTGFLVAVGTPLEECSVGTCLGGVLVWQVSDAGQTLRAALRPDAGIGLGTDVAVARFSMLGANLVYVAAPGALSPFIIDPGNPSLSPLRPVSTAWPGVTAIKPMTLMGGSAALVFGQPGLSRAVAVTPALPTAPLTSFWSGTMSINCPPDSGVGRVIATGDLDSDLFDDVALSNPDTNTVAMGFSRDSFACIIVPTPAGLESSIAFGKALAIHGFGVDARLVVGAPGAAGGVGAVFQFSQCEAKGNCPGTGTDAGAGDAGAPLDAGTPDAGDAGAPLDAGTPDGGDAGAPLDAGTPDAGDAGTPVDAGTPDGGDAGAPLDAGTPDAGDAGASVDAGMPGDGGLPDDAGAPVDAGLADAGDAGRADGGLALTFVPVCGCTDAPGSFSLAVLALMLTLRRWTRRT